MECDVIYGNDGVCLFKYFVQDKDRQRAFVWAILALNFVCFLFISISYIFIALATMKSSTKLNMTGKSQVNEQILERNQKMNQRVALIIGTDCCCWIPYIVACILHSLEVLDASPWNGVFSMTILPINSVINPILYDRREWD